MRYNIIIKEEKILSQQEKKLQNTFLEKVSIFFISDKNWSNLTQILIPVHSNDSLVLISWTMRGSLLRMNQKMLSHNYLNVNKWKKIQSRYRVGTTSLCHTGSRLYPPQSGTKNWASGQWLTSTFVQEASYLNWADFQSRRQSSDGKWRNSGTYRMQRSSFDTPVYVSVIFPSFFDLPKYLLCNISMRSGRVVKASDCQCE